MKMKVKSVTTFLLFGLLIVVAAPPISIWSVNTLFGTEIAFGFKEWLAAFLLMQWVKPVITYNKD